MKQALTDQHTNEEILRERVRLILDERNIDKSHYPFYFKNLQPEAIENQDKITDEMILNQIIAKELFWGLGEVLVNYVAWEKEQY